MEKVIESGSVDESRVEIFARNRLILIAPADNPAEIESPADLADEGVLLVLAAPGAPIRAYTDAMLAAHNHDYGADFSQRVLRNLVSEESNVRQVVARVALGEADAGVVYQSDALGAAADQLIVIAIDERHNPLAAYPIAPLLESAEADLADAFIDFVRSQAAQAILAEHGFCRPMPAELEKPEGTPAPAPSATEAAPEIDCEAPALEAG